MQRSNNDNYDTMDTGKLLKSLYFNRTGLLLLVLTIIALPLLFVGSVWAGTVASTIALSVGSGLLASTIFSVLYIYLSNVEFIGFFTNTLRQETKRNRDSILDEIRQQNHLYMPLRVFQPTIGLRSDFNVDFGSEFRRTSNYTFKGFSGKWVPVRLRAVSKPFGDIRLILIDPFDENSFSARVRHAMNLARPAIEKDYQDSRRGIIDDMVTCLIGLYDHCRYKCRRIEIALTSDTSVDRYEITDYAIFLTLFHRTETSDYYYPKSLKFSSDSVIYDIFKRESEVIIDAKKTSLFVIDHRTSEEDFLNGLAVMGFSPLTSNDLAVYRKRFEDLFSVFAEAQS